VSSAIADARPHPGVPDPPVDADSVSDGVHVGAADLTDLGQGEMELACATADRLLTRELPSSERVRALLKTFRTEAAATGSARARSWLNDTRSVHM
jgi:hypothetical protein